MSWKSVARKVGEINERLGAAERRVAMQHSILDVVLNALREHGVLTQEQFAEALKARGYELKLEKAKEQTSE